MALSTMYPAKPGSPVTSLVEAISADATSMTVDDATVLPTAPNICVLGSDSSAEIVSYTDISGNVVSGLVRGLGGTTASAWEGNTAVARNITSLDHDTFINNINDLNTNKAPLASPALSGIPTAPTAEVGTNNTQIATTAFVTSHDSFKITGTVSASNYTLTDSRINNEHWEVEQIYFATPSNVTSKIDWSTNITNHHVSLSATYAGSTNVIVKMHWVQ